MRPSTLSFDLLRAQPLAVPCVVSALSIDRRKVPAAQSAWFAKPMYFSVHAALLGQPQPNAIFTAAAGAVVLLMSPCSICTRTSISIGLMPCAFAVSTMICAADFPFSL